MSHEVRETVVLARPRSILWAAVVLNVLLVIPESFAVEGLASRPGDDWKLMLLAVVGQALFGCACAVGALYYDAQQKADAP